MPSRKKSSGKKTSLPHFSLWHFLICIALFIILLIMDQLTKRYFLASQHAVDFSWLSFHLVKNTGASFGMFKAYGTVLLWLSVVVLAGLIIYFPRARFPEKLALSFIAAGLVGNLLNRIMLGYVIDFIDLKFWPVFNIADSAIFVGVVGLGIVWLRKK
ncbi:MAG: signal peptidase II [Nanoarchaeota archaeon]